MIREIDRRDWEIGLHPSWYSFDDAEEMKCQKAALETALGHDVVSVRQHYLHYDIRVTPRIQAEAGLRYDSTLEYLKEKNAWFWTVREFGESIS